MANENKEMSDIIKKCKVLLLDIEGTTTSISFVKDKLFPYAEENVKQFLDSKWDSDDVKEVVSGLRKLALEDKENNVEGLVPIPGEDAGKEEQIEGLVNNVKWQMSMDRKVGPLKVLQGLIWKLGYDNGDIKGHVYDDVSPALEQWRTNEGQKIYIYSSGSVEAQKLLFGQSLAGDMLPLIDGHFDTAVGAKQEAASYANIVEKIGCKSDEILFLTDIPKEAEAAKESGLHAVLVSREGNAPLSTEATETFPVIHSFQQLCTKKRKPDTQEEQPAKVPKTDVEDDVKTGSEAEPKIEDTNLPPAAEETKDAEKSEQMEVEEAPEVDTATEVVQEKKPDESPVETTTIVEEISDSNEIIDTPVIELEPIVIEENDKPGQTDKNETEKMDAEPIETSESNEPKQTTNVKKVDSSVHVAEETPPIVITEIEDISEKPNVADAGEIIDDLEPVVEEPPAVEDMDDLQNVGEVLEKECDEILSKVQDVTNLDNIPLKPLLSTITEETMETENVDSNDIVDRILDTELELENMKQCDDIDLNTVQEITDTKMESSEEKNENVETSVTNDVPAAVKGAVEETTEAVESNNVTDGNIVSFSKDKESEKKQETNNEKEKDKVKETANVKVTEDIKESDTLKETDNAKETDNVKEKDNVKETDTVSKESEPVLVDSAKPEKVNKEALAEESTTAATEEPINKTDAPVSVDVDMNDVSENQVNGKATNGDAETNLNGDASNDEELSSRLSVEENGMAVNGSNGESNGAPNGADNAENSKTEELTDIKVKNVAVDEPRTDPIEQPTEA